MSSANEKNRLILYQTLLQPIKLGIFFKIYVGNVKDANNKIYAKFQSRKK